MTLAAVWRHGDRLFAIADTRIVRSPGNVLTEHGPKLLPVTLICWQPGASGFFDREAFRTTFGFAYAGAALPALATHALANALLQVLRGPSDAPAPDFAEAALAIGRIAYEYTREVGERSGGAARFASIVFGYCQLTRKFRAFELQPDLASGSLQIRVEERKVDEDEDLVIIGINPELLRKRVAKMRQDAPAAIIDDLPRRALRALIAEEAEPTVGGTIQYGWATQVGFEPVANAEPIVPPLPSGRNIASLILGFDQNSFPAIGQYFLGMVGRV